MTPPDRQSLNASFGLIAWLEETRIVLPLKAVDADFTINGDLAEVSLDQVFHQTSRRPLDVTYSFPLPAGAAVFRCELIVNDRIIEARVEEQGKARQIAREMKAQGRRVGLVEVERDNLFTLSLGNVQPDDLIVVRFAWFQALDHAGRTLSLAIPFTPGIRYIPGEPLLRSNRGKGTEADTNEVPDASRITPPRIDALHPDAALISLKGRIDARFVELGSVTSATHPVIIRDEKESLVVSIPPGGHVPDRDFVLRWQERIVSALDLKPVSCVDEHFRYAVVRLDAPADAPVAAQQNRDYYFLVDRSGSMQGRKWECTARALNAFVDELGESDKVWVTLFESAFQDYAEAPLPAGELRADPAFRALGKLGTGGGTELLPALNHVIRKIAVHSAGRDPVIVIITDGQVGNEPAVLKVLRDHRGLAIHTFGIDSAVNDAFLKQVAGQHRGACMLMTPNDDTPGAVRQLGNRLRRPVLTNLTLVGGWEITSAHLPDVHAGEHILVALRGSKLDTAIELTGQLANATAHTYRFDLHDAPASTPRLLWARQAIDRCLAEDRNSDAIALAIQHNVVCRGTAFIAYDTKEKVTIAKEDIYQPAQEPVMVRACSQMAITACMPAGSAPAPTSLGKRRIVANMRSALSGPSLFDRLGDSATTILGKVKKVFSEDEAVQKRVQEIGARHSAPMQSTLRTTMLAEAWSEKARLVFETRQGLMVSAQPYFEGNILFLLKTLLSRWGSLDPVKRFRLLDHLIDEMVKGDVRNHLLTFIKANVTEHDLADDLKWIVDHAKWEAREPGVMDRSR